MPRSLANSNAHFKEAEKYLPLGVSSNFRYWGDDKTIYAKRAKGGRIWDIDDNEYIDYRLGYGPAILGYADERVDAAARDGMDVGGVFALGTPPELTVAKRINKMVPSAELIRYSNSGTEAVMAALRLARAHSGRDSFVLIEGAYHGLFDAVLWESNVEHEEWEPGKGAPPLEPFSAGVPQQLRQHIFRVPLNDANRLETLFKTYGSEIGAMLIEPIMGNCCSLAATPEYMKDVRRLCDEYDILLVIDEVKTGFRVARGGVQELYDVKADICTFAKAVANGYPLSVLAGREDIMRLIGDTVAHGGTYTAHSVSMAAAVKTLEILDETDALENIKRYGLKLQDGLSEILDRAGIPHAFSGHPSMGGMFLSEKAPSNYRDWIRSDYTLYEALAPELHDLGILVEPDSREPWFICEAHDQTCLDETLDKFERAIKTTLDKLSREEAKQAAKNG